MRLRTLALYLVTGVTAVLPAIAIAQEELPWQQRDGRDARSEPYADNSDDRSYGGAGGGYGNNDDTYRAQGDTQYGDRRDSFSDPAPRNGGYGEPYSPPRANNDQYNDRGYSAPPPQQAPTRMGRGTYEQGEIITAGHKFFGSISQGLASAVEYAFQSQGRPNGYVLGQDAGGAFIFGLRYGEGTLYTKDAGTHPVFWQGPSLGYDAGAEGSKTMVLVYNMRDPSEIYHRFAGVQGAAYLIGGVSVQFQKYGDVMLGIIRSGVGLRLGANVGYLKYTRTPTWNPL